MESETIQHAILEATKQALQSPISRPRYRLPIDEATATEMLRMAYIQQVALRGKEAVLDQYTEQSIRKIGRWLTSETGKPMLLLYGGVGNGKTTMARAIKSVMNTLAKINNDRNKSVAFVEMVTAKQQVRSYRSDSKSWESLCKRHYLIIDDFGEEPVEVMDYGNVINPVIDLLSQRYDDQHLTILTTNVTNKQIRKTYGDRIADRFNEIMKVIIFTNPSYRS